MPRTNDFFDGQQSATPPSLGSLNRTVTGTEGVPSAVTAAGGITPVGDPIEMIFVVGDDGGGTPAPVNISANPQIAAGATVGEELNLTGTSNTNTVTLEDGDGLTLLGSCDLDAETILNLLWTGTVWREMSRS